MAGLIRDVTDFARTRLGGGFTLKRNPGTPLAPVLEDVVNELRAAHPDRAINSHITLLRAVNCDPNRIAQLLSNLIGNALTHGAHDRPVDISASTHNEMFELAVTNRGNPIPPLIIERLFQPFFRVAHGTVDQGLGLGLYISSEIVRVHGGTLGVTSTTEETQFTVRIPL